jgi:hypothetical protein
VDESSKPMRQKQFVYNQGGFLKAVTLRVSLKAVVTSNLRFDMDIDMDMIAVKVECN